MNAPLRHGPKHSLEYSALGWHVRQRPAPVSHSRNDMAGHGTNRTPPIARAERLDNGKMLVGFRGQAMIVIVRFRVIPGHVSKCPKQGLQSTKFVNQKRVARAPAITSCSLLSTARASAMDRGRSGTLTTINFRNSAARRLS